MKVVFLPSSENFTKNGLQIESQMTPQHCNRRKIIIIYENNLERKPLIYTTENSWTKHFVRKYCHFDIFARTKSDQFPLSA